MNIVCVAYNKFCLIVVRMRHDLLEKHMDSYTLFLHYTTFTLVVIRCLATVDQRQTEKKALMSCPRPPQQIGMHQYLTTNL